ncbi:FAD-dependent oxidoreductase [Nocardioides sp. Bht2]|uniref:FAD-dependent oxidoreductase n=1 Tax=Nocardioides sp. Bht2 TaxID=3392297 RepID=UPI0039B45C28
MSAVRVLGAGIVGLSVAEALLAEGHRVEVVDPAPGSGASFAAAGMLTPAGEVWHDEPELLAQGRASLALWPELAARLGVRLDRHGTLVVGCDAGDVQQVERHASLLSELGEVPQLLTRAELRRLEAEVGPRVSAALWLPDEPAVDPRAVVAALRRRIPVAATPSGGAPEVTVIATGAQLPEPWRGLVRPVRGEILRLRLGSPPGHTLRGWVRGEPVYVVPRPDGDVVVGATSEEHDAPAEVSAGGVLRLLQGARELVPALDRAVFLEAAARDRPAAVDNLPLVGPPPWAGGREYGQVVLAAGLHRHGVLLAPLVARLVAQHLATGRVEELFDPRRAVVARSAPTPETNTPRPTDRREP